VTEQVSAMTRLAGELAAQIDARTGADGDDGYGDAVQRLLAVVRTQLGMQAAWVSEFVGDQQVLRFVDAEQGAAAPEAGATFPLSASFCARVLDGRFPCLIPDARAVPEAVLLADSNDVEIGSYTGVPLVGPQGAAVGMLCAVSDRPNPGLSDRDVAAMRLLADLLRDLQRRAMTSADAVEERDRLRRALTRVIDGTGRHAVLQPVVDLTLDRAVAAEGLTRFTSPSPAVPSPGVERTPAQWFDDAARLGMRSELEVAAAEAVLDMVDGPHLPPEVAVMVNLGPQTITSPAFSQLLHGRPLDRIVVEMTEHAPVADYALLEAVLQPYRAAGLRIAVDDAGAGYASLRHVLAVRPDLLKVDMALIRGVDTDLARQTLLTALASFATSTDCRLVAEGIETESELHAVQACGVELAQGYLLARPSVAPAWECYAGV
jgi:EAL domain-containing protein (putative c-di-GMP-specific phosphodiesterase class I)